MDRYEKLEKSLGYIVLGGLLIAYFFLQTILFEKPLLEMVKDYKSILHIIFTTFASVMVVSIAQDKGVEVGIERKVFKDADKENNEMIEYFSEHYEELMDFVEYINELKKKETEKNFLFQVGKKRLEDLTKKELKVLKKIKPMKYTTKGITLPLFYETVKNNTYDFDASYNEGKKKLSMLKKVVTGLLFGAMTVDIIFSFKTLGDAFVSTIILGMVMSVNYFYNYNVPLFKLTKKIPKKVSNKQTFYNMFKKDMSNPRRKPPLQYPVIEIKKD